ncbi:NAD(P)-dependent dehydrogenase (short-subunit alcohol dehydrogenase family) [Ancylobacter sp. 3268]|uniref:SDR family oxidoreductase n=1 Tax=Ancylobacter sp. 3268 TaxID=2817752 RepID=UPI00285E2EE9|nr:SDR family oxidoreductase [Ancylobacter sp. 3268]MDR6953052.1 NAD(P)-dependent dehydrogenase (short-subunit alcohol dehydrogenase family) [Ancylobacter sp. 3268]
MSTATPRTLIVTGGSKGIGAAIAGAAGLAGFRVALSYKGDAAGAERVARGIEAAGAEALIVRADVAREADVLALFEAVDARFGPPDVLVNNAGGVGPLGRVEAIGAEALAEVMAINVLGSFLCCREAVKRMSTRHGGRGGVIVNMSSRAAELGGAGEWVHYAASKGAVNSLTIGLAREVAAEGIRVNAVAPGLIATNLHAAAGAPDRLERLGPSIPMQRPGTAGEVADIVMWLASPASAYVTGAIVPVAGGR